MLVNNTYVEKTMVWTALITPMLENGRIDIDSLGELVQAQTKAGNGIVLFGSTGEGLALTLDEKKAILKNVLDMQSLPPIMVGVGGFHLSEQLSWLAFCETLNISAYLMVVPLYAKPGPVGQTAWFEALLNKVTKPCMLYNVPTRVGTVLHPQVLNNLKDNPYLWAVKEASGNIAAFKTYQTAAARLSICLYSGDDVLMPQLAKAGAKGLVSVASNIWPEAVRRYAEFCLSDHLDASMQALWKQASEACFCAPNPLPVKLLLTRQGKINSAYCRPPLSQNEQVNYALLKMADRAVNAWYEGVK